MAKVHPQYRYAVGRSIPRHNLYAPDGQPWCYSKRQLRSLKHKFDRATKIGLLRLKHTPVVARHLQLTPDWSRGV